MKKINYQNVINKILFGEISSKEKPVLEELLNFSVSEKRGNEILLEATRMVKDHDELLKYVLRDFQNYLNEEKIFDKIESDITNRSGSFLVGAATQNQIAQVAELLLRHYKDLYNVVLQITKKYNEKIVHMNERGNLTISDEDFHDLIDEKIMEDVVQNFFFEETRIKKWEQRVEIYRIFEHHQYTINSRMFEN